VDEKSLGDMLSKIISDEVEQKETQPQEVQSSALVEGLKSAAGLAGGDVQGAVEEFLGGKGDLLDTTRAAVERGGTSAKSVVAAFLQEKFKLSPTLAGIIAPLLVRLFPAIGKLTGTSTAADKPKPRRKKKPTASTAKPAASSKKKPKKKETATAKPKKKKTPGTTKKKPKRSGEIDVTTGE